jgi:hypothetical protein
MNERELQAFKVGFCKRAAELGVTPSELLRYKVAYMGMLPEPMEGGGGGPYSGPGLDLGPTLRGVERDLISPLNRIQWTPGGGFYGPWGVRPGSPFTRENPYSEAINDPNTFGQVANSYPRMNPMIPGAGIYNGATNLAGLLGAQRLSREARSDRERARQSERARLDPGLQAYEQHMNSQVATPATVKFGPERDARIAAQTAARENRDRRAATPNLPYADRAGGFSSSPAPAAPQAAPRMTPEIRAGFNAAADAIGRLPGGGFAAAAMQGAAGTPYFLARQPGGPGDEAMSPAVIARRAENAKLKSDLGLDIGSTPSPSAGSESFAFGSGRKATPPAATAAAPGVQTALNRKVSSVQDIGASAIKTLLLAASAGTLAGGASGALANYLYNKSKDVVDPEQSMLPEFSEADEAKKLHLIARYRNAADEIRRGIV